MASEVKKRKIFNEKENDLSEEDINLKKDLFQLVENIVNNKSTATSLSKLRKLMRTSTTSITAVPKPLKYLKTSYDALKKAHGCVDEECAPRLADVISVLALAAASNNEHECLNYCLRGTLANPGRWGHEYVRRLETEIVDEWNVADDDRIVQQLLPLVEKILSFNIKNNAEIQACDLCLEIDQLRLLNDCMDENNFSKLCLYLVSCADYSEDFDRRDILKAVTDHYLKFKEYSKAILTAMQLTDSDLVYDCFTKCPDPLVRKQLAYILARQKDKPLKKPYKGEDAAGIDAILSNGHINAYYHVLIRELDLAAPLTPEEIYKSWLEPNYSRLMVEHDSARNNLAASFASAFVHAGLGADKLMSDPQLHWVFKNKDHGMLSATASLGLLHIWDVDGGLVPIDKYLYVANDFVKSGALLAIGIVNCGVRNECDPALALLSEHVMSANQDLRIGAILGLGLAYAASRRSDLNDLLLPPLQDKAS